MYRLEIFLKLIKLRGHSTTTTQNTIYKPMGQRAKSVDFSSNCMENCKKKSQRFIYFQITYYIGFSINQELCGKLWRVDFFYPSFIFISLCNFLFTENSVYSALLIYLPNSFQNILKFHFM